MLPKDIRGKTIFYAILNWGLGHASRSIPLIKQLAEQGNYIDIGSDGPAMDLLKCEIPYINRIGLAELNIHYRNSSMGLNMLLQLPHLYAHFRKDRSIINSIQAQQPYDIIISDHRYACRSKRSHSIFLGHQLSIMANSTRPNKIASQLNARLVNAFNEVWVPDDLNQRRSGILSTNCQIKKPIRYIGPLSRLQATNRKHGKKYRAAVVLSGPEPSRTRLETKIIHQLAQLTGKFILVRGTKSALQCEHPHIKIETILDHQAIESILHESRCLISRAGYSTIMDVDAVGIRSLLIPTEGQTEQHYLASHIKSPMIQFTTEFELNVAQFLGE